METQSRPSSRSASRSSIELLAPVALLATALAAGCGDDAQCGAGDAPADGVTVESGETTAAFGDFNSSPNNDCPPPGDPGGPTSLTVQGAQTDPAGEIGFLILCLPRPDEIGAGAISLTDEDRVQLVDLRGLASDDCDIDLDRDRPLDGTITFTGLCDDGTHPDGYAISFDATVPLLRTCTKGGEAEPIEAELDGEVAVAAGSLRSRTRAAPRSPGPARHAPPAAASPTGR